ncbi:hypothetical protein ABZ260_13445 [Streptosporangium sp. NPDC006013]|uniref:hypothetical protein n=1 Tax=Streptosporangium sp. NPDC006013 TaxID=3155596 RepID=UPI0033B4F459
MPEAAYALREVMQIKRMPDEQRRILLGQARRLQALERQPQEQLTLPRSDAVASEHPEQPSSASTAASGTASEPAGDLSP